MVLKDVVVLLAMVRKKYEVLCLGNVVCSPVQQTKKQKKKMWGGIESNVDLFFQWNG